MVTVEDSLRRQKRAVEDELERAFGAGDSELFQAMRYAVLSGGKRFRPLLLLNAGACCGASDQGMLLPFACAVELLHNYSLVHDDLPSMDDDDTRRGKPSCHKAFGEDIALLAGNGLFTLAFEVMAEAELPAGSEPRRARIIAELCRQAGAEGMLEGQRLDVRLKPEETTAEAYRTLIGKKTGGLIVGAVRAGAILGGASEDALGALSKYGNLIGTAFQVRDDLQDSGRGEDPDRPFRPNAVAVFGEERAERMLRECVEGGIAALQDAGLRSGELRALAKSLLSDEGK